MTVILRYTGQNPVTFVDIGKQVDPWEEFSVPDDQVDGYLVRSDVEKVEESPTTKPVSRIRKNVDTTEEPSVVSDETATGDQVTGTDSAAS